MLWVVLSSGCRVGCLMHVYVRRVLASVLLLSSGCVVNLSQYCVCFPSSFLSFYTHDTLCDVTQLNVVRAHACLVLCQSCQLTLVGGFPGTCHRSFHSPQLQRESGVFLLLAALTEAPLTGSNSLCSSLFPFGFFHSDAKLVIGSLLPVCCAVVHVCPGQSASCSLLRTLERV